MLLSDDLFAHMPEQIPAIVETPAFPKMYVTKLARHVVSIFLLIILISMYAFLAGFCMNSPSTTAAEASTIALMASNRQRLQPTDNLSGLLDSHDQ